MLFYNTTGQGENTIIFVHGNSQNHQVWDEVIADSSLSNYTHIAMDLPGHGQSFRSDDPAKDYTLTAMAEHLQNFVNGISDKPYIIVALSLATNYVAESIAGYINCKGVFLLGPCIIGEGFSLGDILQPNPKLASLFAANPTEDELDGLLNEQAYHITPARRATLKTMFRATDPNLRLQLGTSIATAGYGDEIGNIEKQSLPIAVVYGAEETAIFPGYLQRSKLQYWRNEIIKIPKAGHCAQFDGAEKVAQLVAAFAAHCFK